MLRRLVLRFLLVVLVLLVVPVIALLLVFVRVPFALVHRLAMFRFVRMRDAVRERVHRLTQPRQERRGKQDRSCQRAQTHEEKSK